VFRAALGYDAAGFSEGAVNAPLVTAGLGAVLLLATAAGPALAQRDRSPEGEVQRLIDQLTPGTTRGIRVPGEAPPPRPAPESPPERTAAPAARPAAPPKAPAPAAATTAPAGVPAASLTVFFATGSAMLTPQAERQLEALGRALTSAQLGSYRFRIEGHTDSVGTRESNQALSERRAAAVREYLMRRFGVPEGRLESVGVGEDQPLVQTPDETADRRNRRVQVVNLGA
jgi:outer membrane protein OmpA-like peptidoglycan-associated protein